MMTTVHGWASSVPVECVTNQEQDVVTEVNEFTAQPVQTIPQRDEAVSGGLLGLQRMWGTWTWRQEETEDAARAAPAPEDGRALGGRTLVAVDDHDNDHADGAVITAAQNDLETAQHTQSSASSNWWSTCSLSSSLQSSDEQALRTEEARIYISVLIFVCALTATGYALIAVSSADSCTIMHACLTIATSMTRAMTRADICLEWR